MNHKKLVTPELVIGLALVMIGALFLFGEYAGLDPWRLWPLFIIVPGLLFFVGMTMDGQTAWWLAIPGSILTMLGAIMLYQSLSGHWESWAYAWALVLPTSIGVGLVIQGSRNGERYVLESGVSLIRTGLILFLLAGGFFEVILNVSGFQDDRAAGLLWPVLLIGAGLCLLFGHSSLWYQGRGRARQTERLENKRGEIPPGV